MHMESSVSPGYFNALRINEPLQRSIQRVMRETVSNVYEVSENRPNHQNKQSLHERYYVYSLDLNGRRKIVTYSKSH